MDVWPFVNISEKLMQRLYKILFPPPHFEKLEGHIAFDFSFRPSATIFRMDIVTFEPLQPVIYEYLIRK